MTIKYAPFDKIKYKILIIWLFNSFVILLGRIVMSSFMFIFFVRKDKRLRNVHDTALL